MRLYHDSRDEQCRFPQGAVPCCTPVMLRVKGDAGIRSVRLRFYDGSEKWLDMMADGDGWFSVTVRLPAIPLLCWYDFLATDEYGTALRCGSPEDGLGGKGVMTGAPRAWQVTVYYPSYETPEWLRRGVMYQIFPDRFCRAVREKPMRDEIYFHKNWADDPILMPEGEDDNCARDFFGGDLRGIEEKLDYLEGMGVTVLYLNPIFQARSNHRYDTADYRRIDPMLGDEEDFRHLCAAAKKRGIRVMLDGVFSHTGEDSVYFDKLKRHGGRGAYCSPDSEYHQWYTFRTYPDDYDCWWGFHTLPTVNKENEEYRDFMFREDGVVRHWLREGASGWRLDVADELTMRFLRSLRHAVKTCDAEAAVLGEVWEDASHKEAHGEMRCYCQGDTLDSVMNYPLREAALDFFTGKADAYALERLIMSQRENYPAPFYYSLMNLAGSHDRARAVNVLCGKTWEELPPKDRREKRLTAEEKKIGLRRYAEMMKLLCALPGIPCVYYGDEAGMEGGPDPFCRGTFPWGNEDTELQEKIRKLLWQRRGSRAMQTGTLRIEVIDTDTLRIIREIKNGTDVFGNAAEDEKVTVEIRRAL